MGKKPPALATWPCKSKALYKRRAATAKCFNAQARKHGMQGVLVRGLQKLGCVALLFALAHNLMRTLALAPPLLALGTTPSAARDGAA
ncbi:MAG: hypothetical protein FJY26_03520 [Betaproteobacteria bacterium]|nr:hypothetical protein [Betaproteobacteria bacterium]